MSEIHERLHLGAAAGPAIRSLELKAVIVSATGACVVDALVMPRRSGAAPEAGAG